MKAFRIVLTHFSQRYHYVPAYAEVDALSRRAMVAFDGMSFNLSMLPQLHLAMPVLRAVFKQNDTQEDRPRSKRKAAIVQADAPVSVDVTAVSTRKKSVVVAVPSTSLSSLKPEQRGKTHIFFEDDWNFNAKEQINYYM
jgi:hypothetical protein